MMRALASTLSRVAAVAGGLALVAGATPVAAQDVTLERVESLLASGRLTEARATLEEWKAAHPPGSRDATADELAHALLLQGRLTADVREAEKAYLSVVLSYPTTSHAPEALLRLGQVLVAIAMADGDVEEARRGASYLQRLITDYPTSPHRAVGALWLTRALELAGEYAEACSFITDAADFAAGDPTLATLFRAQQASACANPDPDTPADAAEVRTPDNPPAAEPSEIARFAVQAAAVSDRSRAEAHADRIRRAGFDPRVVRIEGSDLYRVRIGRYTRTPEATAVARRLREAGFDAVIVTDAHREVR